MSAIYFAIPTDAGQAKIANAIALGIPLKITHMAVGDGNGQPVTPNSAQTSLVREKRRALLNTLCQDPLNPAQLVAEQIIPENVGGWWIREVGLYDETSTLIAIANSPDTYKPQLSEGSGRTQTIRMVLIVSDTSAVELKIDPSVVLATRKYVDDVIKAHRESRDHPDANTTYKGMVRKATDEEAKLGQSIEAVMTAKNVADAVKEMLKQMFVGVPLAWMSATPPAWALNMTGQAINKITDPILFERYPSGYLDDMRAMTIKGFDNGRGLDPNRQILSFQPGSLAYGDDDWSGPSMALSGLNLGNRAASSYGAPVPANYPNTKTGNISTTSTSGTVVNFNAAGVTQVDNKAFNYITMRG
ncbi:phage tail protein [Aeromonas enteropelogenes]|uniref:phage tail protein n=1 Tax=Aeromonas enteropelogenes TaxID=29489 RepID=UPI003BA0EF56